jgi:sugar lactone lactonase YvrE
MASPIFTKVKNGDMKIVKGGIGFSFVTMLQRVIYASVLLFVMALWSACDNDDDAIEPGTPAPTVLQFSPASGQAGTNVTITGTNFAASTSGNIVKFNGTPATIVTATASSLVVVVPAGATTGKITVSVGGQSATSVTDFTVSSAASPVTITGFSPATGKGGTIVTVTGTNFSTIPIGNFVTINGTPALITSATGTSLTVVVPDDATTGKITVKVGNNSATSTDDFVFDTTSGLDVTTFAGSGVIGSANGVGTAAEFFGPEGIAFDAAGNLYVADLGNHRIQKVTPDGTVTTLAGSGVAGFADGVGTAAQFSGPTGIAVDADGNIYVADTFTQRIRKITPTGTVTTLAGGGTYTFGGAPGGFADGPGADARFFLPKALAIDASGNIFVADDINNRIRKVTPAGIVTTFAGTTKGFADGTGTSAQFDRPSGIAIDESGNLYVADEFNTRIRKITPAGAVTTLAGSTSGFADGNGTAARFKRPKGIAVDNDGNVYVADAEDNRIRKITPTGTVSTIAGDKNGFAGYKDGPGDQAMFRAPSSIAIDASGNIFVGDAANHRIRMMN